MQKLFVKKNGKLYIVNIPSYADNVAPFEGGGGGKEGSFRITETGQYRITEDDKFRSVET